MENCEDGVTTHILDSSWNHNHRSRAAALVVNILAAWKASRLTFVVLRNYRSLPEYAGNDLDVLVSTDERRIAARLMLKAAQDTGFRLHSTVPRTNYSPISYYFYHVETHVQYHVDFHTDLNWLGFRTVQPSTILARRTTHHGISVPHPIDEANINLLTRLLYHGYIKSEYKNQILHAFQSSPHDARSALALSLGGSASNQIVDYVLSEDWKAIEAGAGRWRWLLAGRHVVRHPLRVIGRQVGELARLVGRFITPPGLMLVMLGPDGCGKSSLAAAIMERLHPTFAQGSSRRFHWKPMLFRRAPADGAQVTSPHSKPARGRWPSLFFFCFHWLEFALGSNLLLRTLLFRNGLVVADRYYHDFFVDPRRYRLRISPFLFRFAFGPILKPNLVIFLDAPTGVLQSRKQEVAPKETDRQRAEYLRLASKTPNAHVVDTSRPFEEVVTRLVGLVLDEMAQRARGRLKRAES